jgi:hypothetical protein
MAVKPANELSQERLLQPLGPVSKVEDLALYNVTSTDNRFSATSRACQPLAVSL